MNDKNDSNPLTEVGTCTYNVGNIQYYCIVYSNGNLQLIATLLPTTTTTTSKPRCSPQSSFVFIKIHKSGSTTMIAPFQKYAYLHNLTMMVPALNNNIHLSWPFPFMPYVSHMAPPHGHDFQALVNHIVYDREKIRPMMDPTTKYLTVVREPIPHLISAYQYFSVNLDNMFLRLGPKDFELFLSDPEKYDPKPKWMAGLNNTQVKSLTRNLQSADLGLRYGNFDNVTAVNEFVNEIKRDFSILLVLERLAESLVLMKRKFCWSMQDILHVNKNIQKTAWGWNIRNISQQLVPKIYQWNNADTLLYQMANTKLNDLRRNEKNLEEEINLYIDINTKVSQYCNLNSKHWKEVITPQPLIIGKTEFNERFEVDAKFCTLLLIPEEDFTLLHKCRQYPGYPQCQENSAKINGLRSLTGEQNLTRA